MSSKKILFIYTGWSSFVRTDYEILSSEFKTDRLHVKPPKGIAGIFVLLKEFFYLLFRGWKYDVFFIWFADYHAFMPVLFSKIFGKKSYVVIGGYDVARMRGQRYGAFISAPRGFAAGFSMRNSTLNLAVSEFVARKVKAITRKENCRLVYNCVNLSSIVSGQNSDRNIVLTVVNVTGESTFFIKGLDTYVEVARLMTGTEFHIVGLDPLKFEGLIQSFPQNVHVTGFVEHARLVEYYMKARVYCQFSRTESFGVALAEAIWYDCIPLVTNVGGMPEVVGDKNFVVMRDTQKLKQKLENLFENYQYADNQKIKLRVFNLFSKQTRKEHLIRIIST